MRRIPLLRGVLILAETLWLGMKSLQRSAVIAAEEPSEQEQSSSGSDAVSNVTMGLTMVIALALGIGIFLVLPLLAVRLIEPFIGSLLVSNLIEGVIRLVILVGYVAGISLMRDIRRVYAYHGAEHMAVHTYEAGQPLTVENVRRHPTPHPRWRHGVPDYGGHRVGSGVRHPGRAARDSGLGTGGCCRASCPSRWSRR